MFARCIGVALLCCLGSAALADERGVDAAFTRAEALETDGDHRAAAKAFQEIARAAASAGRHLDETDALLGQFRCLEALHAYGRLLPVAERLREVLLLRKKHADATVALADIGALHCELGDYARANEVLERALGILAKGEDQVAHANALSTLAIVHLGRGRFSEAIDTAERALALYAGQGASEDVNYARQTLATVYNELGLAARAVPYLEAVLEDVSASTPSARGSAMGSLGIALYRAGDTKAARETLTAAWELLERAEDGPARSRLALHRGEVAEREGAAAQALKHYRTALALADGEPSRLAWSHVKIGDALLLLPEPDAQGALASYEKAREIGETLGDPTLLVEAGRGRAEALLGLGKKEAAHAAALEALEELELLDTGLANEQISFMREHFEPVHAAALQASLAVGTPTDVFAVMERGRAGMLVAMLGGSAAVPRAEAGEKLAAQERAARTAVYEAQAAYNHAVRRRDRDLLRKRRTALRLAQRGYRGALEAIERATATGDRSIRRTTFVDESTHRKALQPGDVHLQYVLRERLSGVLVTGAKGSRWVTLPPLREIQPRIDRLRRKVRDLEPTEESARSVAMALLDPVTLPPGTKRLLITPDGAIGSLPFGLLLPASPKTRGRVTAVGMVPSATAHALLTRQRAWTGKGVLALGHPDYSVDAARRLQNVYIGDRSGFLALPGSEAEAIEKAGPDDVLLTRKRANETALRQALARKQRYRVVHLACHGLANHEAPCLSALALAPSKGHDGFLTAVEIFGLSVDADLVVLSACESAIGRSIPGHGLLGLSRAFLCAGTPRVLASLWLVDSEATTELMRRFHRELRREGVSVGEALRRAQEHVRGKPGSRWHHPHYWSGWVLWGLPD